MTSDDSKRVARVTFDIECADGSHETMTSDQVYDGITTDVDRSRYQEVMPTDIGTIRHIVSPDRDITITLHRVGQYTIRHTDPEPHATAASNSPRPAGGHE